MHEQLSFPGREFGKIYECNYDDGAVDHLQFRKNLYAMIFPGESCRTMTGIELGALHQPANIPPSCHAGRIFVDKYDTDTLRGFYGPSIGELVDVQLLDDAEKLVNISSDAFDYVIGSHILEHMENPVAAIESWFRVLKPGGMLIFLVPNKCQCFDKGRIVTSLEHIRHEYFNPAFIAANNHQHKREWAISHFMAGIQIHSLKTYTPKLNQFDSIPNTVQLLAPAFVHGSWHVHTWDVNSFTSFVHKLGSWITMKMKVDGHVKIPSISVKLVACAGLDMAAVLVKN